MRLPNGSSTSLGSNKDKELPPIPPYNPSNTSTDKLGPGEEPEILEVKTLKRKNFKKLSLEASPGKVPEDNEESLLNLQSHLRPRRKVRPAPLIFNKSKNERNTSGVTNGAGEKADTLSVNESNRNVDPESITPTQMIMKQFSKMEISGVPETSSKPQGRKRQTVISSISPTNSTLSPSPSTSSKYDTLSTVAETSPISTTSLIKLNNKDLLTLKNLGSGNSGTVSKILHIPTQKTMAKKIIHIESKTVIQTQIIRELRILHECRSQYIIEFYGAFINSNNTIVICMEYCNCGSLDKIVPYCENKQFPLFALKKLSFAILSGLTYLYTTHKIIHRDIKPSNVLMTHKGEFKLCDFGVSRELTNSLAMADTFVGTSTYMSPERIQGLTYGIKSDVWSMGLMLIELASGVPIWSEDNENSSGPGGILDLLQRIVNEMSPTLTNTKNPVTNEYYDSSMCKFIDSCLIKDESSRKSPFELLEEKDGFLAGVKEGIYDKDLKSWAKKIRKYHKDKNEPDNSS